ncbi:MAG: FtsX-like permease family protein [Lachnospiraceae bacterium]|nr:FtsX-like permease family protein [Lachnospiraceae bacterium]
MKSKLKLLKYISKVTFFKAKDTKWVVMTFALIMMMTSVLFSIGDCLSIALAKASVNTGAYDVIIYNLSEKEANEGIEKLKEKGLISFSALSTDTFYMDIKNTDFYVSCIGMDEGAKEIYNLDIIEGDYPKKPNEILMDVKIKQGVGEGCKIGDEFDFSCLSTKNGLSTDTKLVICGFFDPHVETNELSAMLSIQGVKEIYEKLDSDSQTFLFLRASDSTSASIENLVMNIDFCEKEKININEQKYNFALEKENAGYSSTSMGFKKLAIVICILSMLLLLNMFKVSTTGKIAQFGVLRSLGMDRKQLSVAMLVNMFLYLVTSTFIGFILYVVVERLFGAVILRAFLDSFRDSDGMIELKWTFNTKSFLICALLLLLMISIVYIEIIIKVVKLSPLAAVNYRENVVDKKKNEGKSKEVKEEDYKHKTNFIEYIGKRNLLRNKFRSLYTGFTMFIISVLLMTVILIASNVNLYDMDILKKGNLADYEFYEDNNETPINEEIMSKINSIPSIEKAYYVRDVTYELFQDKNAAIDSERYVRTRVYSDEIIERIIEENQLSKNLGEEIFLIIDNNNSEDNNEKLVLYDKNHEAVEISINAFIKNDNYCNSQAREGSLLIVMNEKAGKRLFGDLNYNRIMIKAGDIENAKNDLIKLLESENIRMYYNDLKGTQSRAREQLKSIMSIISYVILIFCIMILANMISNININCDLRRYEYGLLLAIGLNRKKIVRVMIFENTYLMRYSIIFSLPIAIGLSFFALFSIEQEINYIKYFLVLLSGSIILYLAVYIICYIRGNQIFKKNISVLIRGD